MDRSTKFLAALIAISVIAPLIVVAFMLADGADTVDIMIQALFLYIMLPLIAMGAYMWATGKGAMLLAGYNTSPKAVRDLYDSKALSKFVGMLLTISLLLMLAGMEAIFLSDSMLLFWVLFIASLVVLFSGLVYANTGGRFLKEGVSAQDVKETAADERKNNKWARWGIVLGVIVTAAILIGVFFFIGSGSVEASLEENDLHVSAPMVSETISYEGITSVEWRDSFDAGRRVGGFGGTDISSGNFQNDEFGRYVLAQYNSVSEHIVVRHAGGILVFNLDTPENTVQMYEDLRSRLP